MLAGLFALLMPLQDGPRFPPHYAAEPMTCPVGGEAFQGPALMHYSTFGALPDGQPFGSVEFPTLLPECPGNGLVVYAKFAPDMVAKLAPLVNGKAYQALRKGETSYYRAHWLAKATGEANRAAWLLLAATWQAKNAEPAGARAKRYDEEFVALVRTVPLNATDLESVALYARAANALRELGRFDEAEALRAAIAIDPAAGGADEAENRTGWTDFVGKLAAPIVRRDMGRTPIDLMSDREAAFRCTAADLARRHNQPAPPALSPFEQQYCRRPALAKLIDRLRTPGETD